MYQGLRSVIGAIFTPLAKGLMRLGVTPDAVTIAGTVVTCTLALWLLPAGHLFWGALLIGIFALFDSLDGVLARLSGTASKFGAFLDSTMDRFADGAVFMGIALYFTLASHDAAPHTLWGAPVAASPAWAFTWAAIAALACLIIGGVVSYVRAKAESMGAFAHVGIFERWLRLVGALVPVGFIQLGLPVIAAAACLTIIAVGSFWTVIERMRAVRQQLGRAPLDQPTGQQTEQPNG
ncbi:MAG: CDP-alcohol phosphatidyltransferase family protein [Cellulomonadaceae bacterium]|jgi:CDP-diacylglycerol--glycerol-3-phosphate 3-phosphatidyltransferase|nr:CDP-alcohol phosphatidyltransferase family protein [Cellulomonadaceae bacterium]